MLGAVVDEFLRFLHAADERGVEIHARARQRSGVHVQPEAFCHAHGGEGAKGFDAGGVGGHVKLFGDGGNQLRRL